MADLEGVTFNANPTLLPLVKTTSGLSPLAPEEEEVLALPPEVDDVVVRSYSPASSFGFNVRSAVGRSIVDVVGDSSSAGRERENYSH